VIAATDVKSYSQYGEDLVIREIFGDQVGTLLDIGAWNAEIFSNSRALIKQGWKAVLVEGERTAAVHLAEFYGGNENVVVVQAAVTVADQGLVKGEADQPGWHLFARDFIEIFAHFVVRQILEKIIARRGFDIAVAAGQIA
jgi:hypothetical protein